MKIFNYLSFLKNKNSKVKLSFCAIIFLAVLIVFADALSIITLLPLVSLISESNVDFQNNIYLNYLPFFLVDYLSKIDIWTIFTILLLTLLFRNVIHLLNNYIIFKFIKYLEVDTSKKIFFLWLNKDYLDFYKNISSELIKDFRDSIGGYIMFIENVTRFISDFIVLILFSIFLFLISFNETLIISIYYIFIFFAFKKVLSNFSLEHGKITNLSSNEINLTIINTYKNFTQIILRKLKKKFLDLTFYYVNKFSYSRLIVSFVKSNTKQFFEISILFFVVIIFGFFNFFNIYSTDEIISLFIIFIVAAYRILPQINNLVSSIIKIKNFQYPFNIIDKQITYFNDKYKKITFTNEIIKEFNFKKTLKLKDIYFSYEKNEPNILNKLNLTIHKGETIGLIGKSGSGKTTIIRILLGLIKPNKGELLIDDKIIEQKNIQNYQNLFSYLSQENLFIPGSIKENIAFGENNINEKKLQEALRVTNCLEFVDRLENNIEHKIIEDGKNFSIGQLQRLALARAIYFDNHILILDEPTSALDSESEKKFLELIDNFKDQKTIIIISHKKETLKNCDNIYEISNQNLVKRN
jgi:ATP-binding cassette, subfamily B, bacterial PglK